MGLEDIYAHFSLHFFQLFESDAVSFLSSLFQGILNQGTPQNFIVSVLDLLSRPLCAIILYAEHGQVVELLCILYECIFLVIIDFAFHVSYG